MDTVKDMTFSTPLALQVENLCKVYGASHAGKGGFLALDNASLEIPVGKTLAIVGESGSGKTTLARIVAGILEPTSGTVRIAGADREWKRRTRQQRYAVQMVFQSPYTSLDPRMRIEDSVREPLDIALGGMPRSEARDRVAAMIERVGLPLDMLKRFPHQMSGGQLQRAGIARALIAEPKLLICDEPTSALDVSVQARVIGLLKDLQAEFSTAYLFVSHDLALVSSIADQVVVMEAGRIVENAPTRDVFLNPKDEYTRTLIANILYRKPQ